MASGVTPKQIYQALIAAGASTTQAIGIMANMIAESGLNPEAVGDQGTSFGLVQQHGAQYAGLVTGNPAADMNAQIKVLAANGGFAAANGANGAAAAGNFSANYERCTTCQPGQASYNQRVANAATVAGWVSSGSWPTSSGSATASAQGGGSGSNSKDPTCAWGFSGSLVVTSLNICVIKKATIRHIVGGMLLLSGSSVLLAGAVILAASAFNHTKAGQAVAQAGSAVVPAGRIARYAAQQPGAVRAARKPPAKPPAKPAAKPAAKQTKLTPAQLAQLQARGNQLAPRVSP